LAVRLDKSKKITGLHLIAGIKKERPALFRGLDLKKAHLKLPAISSKKLSGSKMACDIPLDPVTKLAIFFAAKTADEHESKLVRPAHLLVALAGSDTSLAKKLMKAGLTEAGLRKELGRIKPTKAGERPHLHRSGIGYDLHRLAEGRKLTLGGIVVPFEKGPVGHSDGDALAHAICDALLGAAGLGDIGAHFPDTDPKWKSVSSLLFLEHTRKLLDQRSLRIIHIDAVVILERPKLGPHFPAMRAALAKSLGIEPEQINLKAKTNEGVGEIGRGEAIASHAIATLEA